MDDNTSSPAITSNGASVLQSQPAMTSNAQVLDGQAQIAHQSNGMQSISSGIEQPLAHIHFFAKD